MTIPKIKKKAQLKAIVMAYAENTSIGALPHVFDARTYFMRTLWLCVFIFGFVITIAHLWFVFSRFFGYPVQVTITLANNDTFQFPAVTICNLNPLNKLKLQCGDLDQMARVQHSITMSTFNNMEFKNTMLALVASGLDPIEWLESTSSTDFMKSTTLMDEDCERILAERANTTTTRRTTAAQPRRITTPEPLPTTSAIVRSMQHSHLAPSQTQPSAIHRVGTTTLPTSIEKRKRRVKRQSNQARFENLDSRKLRSQLCAANQVAMFCELRSWRRSDLQSTVRNSNARNRTECATACAQSATCKSYSIIQGSCFLSADRMNLRAPEGETVTSDSYNELICLDESAASGAEQRCTMKLNYAVFSVKKQSFDIKSLQACVQECLIESNCKSAVWYSDPDESKCLLSEITRHTAPNLVKRVVFNTVYIDFEFGPDNVLSTTAGNWKVTRQPARKTTARVTTSMNRQPKQEITTTRPEQRTSARINIKTLQQRTTATTTDITLDSREEPIVTIDGQTINVNRRDPAEQRRQTNKASGSLLERPGEDESTRRSSTPNSREAGDSREVPRFCVLENFMREDIGTATAVRADIHDKDGCENACVESDTCASFTIHRNQCYLHDTILDQISHVGETERGSSYHQLICLDESIASGLDKVCILMTDHVMFLIKKQIMQVTSLDQCITECLTTSDLTCHSAIWYPDPGDYKCLLSNEARLSKPNMFQEIVIDTIYVDFGYDGPTTTSTTTTSTTTTTTTTTPTTTSTTTTTTTTTPPPPEKVCCACECDDKLDLGSVNVANVSDEQVNEMGGAFGVNMSATPEPTTMSPFGNQFFAGFSENDQYEFSKFVSNSILDDLVDVQDLISITPELAQMYGTRVKDFILECTLDREKCVPEKHFFRSFNKRYGSCFTFNKQNDFNTKPNITRKSGSRYGFRVTLNVETPQYVGLLAAAYGVRVSVHAPDQTSFPDNDGFSATPGLKTTVAVRRKELYRLKTPFASNCTDNYPTQYLPYLKQHDGPYSLYACQAACVDYYKYSYCECVENSQDFVRCTIFNQEQRDCSDDINKRMALNEGHSKALICDCAPQCEEVSYETDISTSAWPTDQYMALKLLNFADRQPVAKKFMKAALDDAKQESTSQVNKMKTKQNLVRLHIYLKTMTIEVVREMPAYPASQLLADVGGICGWYLGLTVVALIEFCGFLWTLCYASCCKSKLPRKFTQEEAMAAQSRKTTVVIMDQSNGHAGGSHQQKGTAGPPLIPMTKNTSPNRRKKVKETSL